MRAVSVEAGRKAGVDQLPLFGRQAGERQFSRSRAEEDLASVDQEAGGCGRAGTDAKSAIEKRKDAGG